MISGLRGLVQPIVRAAVRLEMGVRELGWRLKEAAISFREQDLFTDYEKFARQDFIAGEIPLLKSSELIPGHLHEKSLWSLKQTYRYEVLTPWETEEGDLIEQYTTVVSNMRLTVDEVFELAAEHPSKYPPEGGVFHGEMEIVGVWSK